MFTSGLQYFAASVVAGQWLTRRFLGLSPVTLVTVAALASLACPTGAQATPPPESIPVVIGGPQNGRQIAYLWSPGGAIFTATGPAVWAETRGEGLAVIPAGRVVSRISIFAATDRGSCFEGYVQILDQYGSAWAQRAPHKEAPFQNYEAWGHMPVDFMTDGSPLTVRWLCRVGCARYEPATDLRVEPPDYSARCHYAVEFELK